MARLPVPGLEVFLAIVEHGSLRRAAQALGVQPPAVSHQLKTLEDQLGVAVLVRTTRAVHLTEAGRALLSRAKPALLELQDAVETARAVGKTKSGTVKVSLPYAAYELTIAPRLGAFRKAYPAIALELSFDEGFVDIVPDGFHAGVRMGDLIGDDMIAVRLGPTVQQVFFAAPTYLERRGRPRVPKDLLRHDCIRYRYITSKRIAEWQFLGAEGVTTIDVKAGLTVNSTQALVHAACSGLGVGWLFRPNIQSELERGALESLLDDYAIERPGYFLYYPRANAQLETLRIFIDFMKLRAGALALP